jgi:hypothetical protein
MRPAVPEILVGRSVCEICAVSKMLKSSCLVPRMLRRSRSNDWIEAVTAAMS